jgi:hypothetical protein
MNIEKISSTNKRPNLYKRVTLYKFLKKIIKYAHFNHKQSQNIRYKNESDKNLHIMDGYEFLKQRENNCKLQLIQLNKMLTDLTIEYNEIAYQLENIFGECVSAIEIEDKCDKEVMTDITNVSYLEFYFKSCLEILNNVKNL